MRARRYPVTFKGTQPRSGVIIIIIIRKMGKMFYIYNAIIITIIFTIIIIIGTFIYSIFFKMWGDVSLM